MAEYHIRGLDEAAVSRLEAFAREKGMSLNKYMCRVLEDHALRPELKAAEDRYTTLANTMTKLYQRLLEQTTDQLAENTLVLQKASEMIRDRKRG